MAEAPNTQQSLLLRLRDAEDADAWSDFARLYSPAILAFARRKGLQDADAADLAQEVLQSVARSMPDFVLDGRFRSWLFTLVQRRLYDWRRKQQRQEQGSGRTSVLEQLQEQPAPDDEADWNRELQQQTFTVAAAKIRDGFSEATWQAFWLTAVKGRTGQEAAQALGLSVAAVYLAKRRVMAKLKEQVELLS
jgi:RNA polymerase sigma factor (sigma-70 family)